MIKLILTEKGYTKIRNKFPKIDLIHLEDRIFEVNSNNYDLFIQISVFSEDQQFIKTEGDNATSHSFRF